MTKAVSQPEFPAGSAGYPACSTAKASVMGLTRGLTRELRADHTRMQCSPDPLQPPDIAAMVLFPAADADGDWS